MSRQNSLKGCVFGSSAQTTIPSAPTSGTPYRNTSLTTTTAAQGWPFLNVVDSADFNQMMFRTTSVLNDVQKTGILYWSALTDYVTGSICRDDLDGKLYQALQASGPNSGGTHQPSTDSGTYWKIAALGFLSLSGGRMSGVLSAIYDYSVCTLNVGPTRSITSLVDAFVLSRAIYCPNGFYVRILLDNYQADGVSQAVYSLDDLPVHQDNNLYDLVGPTGNLLIMPANSSASVHPKITSTTIKTLVVRDNSKMLLQYLDLENICFYASKEANLQLESCSVDLSAINKSAYFIDCRANSHARIVYCTLTGNSYLTGIYCYMNSSAQFVFTSLSNFSVGFYAYLYSSITASANNVTLSNVTTTSSPAINTQGNYGSYVRR